MGFGGTGPGPVLASGWFLIGVAAAVIIARLYLRLVIQKRKLLLSDVLMVLAWLSGCASTGVSIGLAKLGALDKGVGSTLAGFKGDPANIPTILKLFWLSLVPYHLQLYLCRATLLSVYWNIFPSYMQKRRIALCAVIWYTVLAYVASMLVVFFMCWPTTELWNPHPETTCTPRKGQAIFYTSWSLSTFGDLLVFALPWLVLPGLNVSRRIKLAIYGAFLLGAVTISFAMVRFAQIFKAQVGDAVPLSTPILWSSLEGNLGLVTSCLPALGPYFSLGETPKDETSTPVLAAIDSHESRLDRVSNAEGSHEMKTEDVQLGEVQVSNGRRTFTDGKPQGAPRDSGHFEDPGYSGS